MYFKFQVSDQARPEKFQTQSVRHFFSAQVRPDPKNNTLLSQKTMQNIRKSEYSGRDR